MSMLTKNKQMRQNVPLKAIPSKYKVHHESEQPTNRNWRSENTKVRSKGGHPVLLQPLSKEKHPFPYVKTPDVYLLKPQNDDEQLKAPLQEKTVEKFILDSKFANDFLDNYLPKLLEPTVRDIALTFTNRQGPANKPAIERHVVTAPLQHAKPGHASSKSSIEDQVADSLISESVALNLAPILWKCLDEKSVFLEENKYQQILANDRGYAIAPDLTPKLKQHCIRIAQGIKAGKWPSDYSDFKGIPTKNYIYNLHKLWREHLTADNYAIRQLQMQFINEAIWHSFLNETLDSVRHSLKTIDLEEQKVNSLQEVK
ncbi:hypothetical protein CHUAL_000462 [Chamberlinius hualienensis]